MTICFCDLHILQIHLYSFSKFNNSIMTEQPAGTVSNCSWDLSSLNNKLLLKHFWCMLMSHRGLAGCPMLRLCPRCSLTRRCKCPRPHLEPGSDADCCRCGSQIWKDSDARDFFENSHCFNIQAHFICLFEQTAKLSAPLNL